MARQQRMFNGGNGRKRDDLPVGVGSCVWALVDPAETRTPEDAGFDAPKGWRRAKVYAFGRPFKRLWVRLNRAIGEQDLAVAHRISIAKTKPKSNGAGMTAAEFVRKAGGKMGKYRLATCAR